MKFLRIAMLSIAFMNCVSIEVKSVDEAFEMNVQQKMQEMRNKERNEKIEQESSRRLQQERTKGESKKSDNQMSSQEIKASFDLVQKNILSDDQRVQRAALDLFFRLKSNLNQQQIQLITSQLFNKRVLQDLTSDDRQNSNEARDLFDKIKQDLDSAQKIKLIHRLFEELRLDPSLRGKENYNKTKNIYSFLFALVKEGILFSETDLRALFSFFSESLFSEIQDRTRDEQVQNLQAKSNLQSTGQYSNKKSLELLNILDGLLIKPQLGGWSTGLNLENKQIFQLLFEIVQAVAQESDPEVKSRGLWMLGKMVK